MGEQVAARFYFFEIGAPRGCALVQEEVTAKAVHSARRTDVSVLILEDSNRTKQVWQYGSGRCTLKTAHRKFSIKRAMQTANDADGGNVFPDITAEEAGYSATARIERKHERTRDGALRRNVRKRHQISMIRKSFYITVQRISITDAEHPSSRSV